MNAKHVRVHALVAMLVGIVAGCDNESESGDSGPGSDTMSVSGGEETSSGVGMEGTGGEDGSPTIGSGGDEGSNETTGGDDSDMPTGGDPSEGSTSGDETESSGGMEPMNPVISSCQNDELMACFESTGVFVGMSSEQSCEMSGGTYSEGEPCSLEGAYESCTQIYDDVDSTIKTIYYYDSPITPENCGGEYEEL